MNTVTTQFTNFGDLVIDTKYNGGMVFRKTEGEWVLDFGYITMSLHDYRAQAASFATPARDEALEILAICESHAARG